MPARRSSRVGDEVFGVQAGANAEYVTVRESGVIATKPAELTFEQAAAIPDGALLALTCLRPAEPLRGKRVVVYGAAGSVGTAAVQLLVHHFGAAEVTAVCDTRDVELVRSLGAQHVVDRQREDFTRNGKTYDVVFDAVGKHSFRRCRGSLEPGGTYVTMDLGFMYHVPFLSLATRLVGSKRAKLGIGRYRKEDLLLVKQLVEAGAYRPVIDRTYALDEVIEATRYVESGQKTGNVVLRVSEAAPDERHEFCCWPGTTPASPTGRTTICAAPAKRRPATRSTAAAAAGAVSAASASDVRPPLDRIQLEPRGQVLELGLRPPWSSRG